VASPNVIAIGGDGSDELSLLDILDHVLNSGVVIQGSIVISLGGVDLIYVGLSVVLTSVETALRTIEADRKRSLDRGEWPLHPRSSPTACSSARKIHSVQPVLTANPSACCR